MVSFKSLLSIADVPTSPSEDVDCVSILNSPELRMMFHASLFPDELCEGVEIPCLDVIEQRMEDEDMPMERRCCDASKVISIVSQ